MSNAEALPEERRGCNLIVVGSPGSNQVLSEIYEKGYATEVTADFPGPSKGLLQMVVNPWDQKKALLIIAGSDEQGVTASAGVLTNNEEIAGFDYAMMMVVNPQPQDYSELLGKAATEGHVLVITGLDLSTGPFKPEGTLDPIGVQRQRQAIAKTRQALLDSLAGYDVVVYASWDSVPYVGLKLGLEALQHLIDSPHVTTIQEDSLDEPVGTLDLTT